MTNHVPLFCFLFGTSGHSQLSPPRLSRCSLGLKKDGKEKNEKTYGTSLHGIFSLRIFIPRTACIPLKGSSHCFSHLYKRQWFAFWSIRLKEGIFPTSPAHIVFWEQSLVSWPLNCKHGASMLGFEKEDGGTQLTQVQCLRVKAVSRQKESSEWECGACNSVWQITGTRWGKAGLQFWVHKTQCILVLSIIILLFSIRTTVNLLLPTLYPLWLSECLQEWTISSIIFFPMFCCLSSTKERIKV